jgi:hypothetical protein
MPTENIMHLSMDGDDTSDHEENLDLKDNADRSLITDISASLSYLSPESRKNRQKEKLRKELVREHIESQEKESSLLQSLAQRITQSL